MVILLFRVGLCEPESPDGLRVRHVDEDVGVDLAEDEGHVVAEADLAPPHGLNRGRAQLVVVWIKSFNSTSIDDMYENLEISQ